MHLESPTIYGGRQWIYDFAQVSRKDLYIISANTDLSKIIRTTISEVFPGAFGPQDLGVELDKYRK